MATTRPEQDYDPTPRLGEYFVLRGSPEHFENTSPREPTTPAISSSPLPSPLTPYFIHEPNFPEVTDMFRADMAEQREKQKEAEAQESFNKNHETLYKYTLPTKMQATFKKMLFSPTLNAALTEETSEWVPTIILMTTKGRMMGNSEGKWTFYNDKTLKAIAAIAAARWRQDFSEQLPDEVKNAPVAAPTTDDEPDLSTLTLEDPAKMSAVKKTLLESCICKDPQILALRKVEYSDMSDPSMYVTDNNILIWELQPRLLMCLMGPKKHRPIKKKDPSSNTTNDTPSKTKDKTTPPSPSGGGEQSTSPTTTQKEIHNYHENDELENVNSDLKEGQVPYTQADVDRSRRMIGPLIMLRLKAESLAKYLIEQLGELKIPDNF
ncbi:MAG: hypothetical protein M1812_003865 [Candelaria pacifica]|nr:MAG: hypothetical protein M1812_003865 [Candelaria pacifica]